MNLAIADEEFLVLLGPSGCGKTTTMRMIAGLEQPTAGEIVIGGEAVNGVDARDRDVAMVFQGYALYPNMSVYENIRFPLRMRGVPKEQQDALIRRAAEMVELGQLLDRKPGALSGGQRQRAALARAVVREPQVFLMDEPLSNLDAKLRASMRVQIKHLQRAAQDHHGLRHPRPDRGDDARRPHRHHGQGRDPAGRHARRDLQRPGQHLRRRLHRLAADEPDRRRGVRRPVPRRRASTPRPRAQIQGKVTLGVRPEDCRVAEARRAQGRGLRRRAHRRRHLPDRLAPASQRVEVKAAREFRAALDSPISDRLRSRRGSTSSTPRPGSACARGVIGAGAALTRAIVALRRCRGNARAGGIRRRLKCLRECLPILCPACRFPIRSSPARR